MKISVLDYAFPDCISGLVLQQGRITISAKPGVKLEIPDGAVIENKVSP